MAMSFDAMVKIDSLKNSITQCQAIKQTMIETKSQLTTVLQQTKNEWDDEKYENVKSLIDSVNQSLDGGCTQIQDCEAFLDQLVDAVEDYESVDLSVDQI